MEELIKSCALTLSKKPSIVIDPFDFQLKHQAFKSKCKVEIWELKGKCFIMFTELDNNPGISVTNSANYLVHEIYGMYLNKTYAKEDCLFAEKYEGRKNIDIILPDWSTNKYCNHEWRHLGSLM